jgi:aminopeptidase YwaD
MLVNQCYFFLSLLITTNCLQAQKLKKEDKQLIANLQQHIQYLADDRLEGRLTGSAGEKLAATYIIGEFDKIGLQPKGNNGFYQDFEVNEGKQINAGTKLSIDGKNLQLYTEFFPLALSPDIIMEAHPSMALQEPATPWFYDLKDMMEEYEKNPHLDIEASLARSVREVHKKGATAVFLYNSSDKEDGLKFNGKDRSEVLPIPVIYITKAATRKYLQDESATLAIQLVVSISEKKRTGHNVLGFIDNGAPTTIVIGAHYDHLGYGEDGNSRETKKGLIHNGADDNASGTAAMIELARMLRKAKLKHNNYLFIAFSGEELGLYGSKHFTDSPTVNLDKINYMINMDMVGRLSDSSHLLTVSGYGTSPSWGTIYNGGKKKLYTGDLNFRFDSSGTGPSDHTSFYLKNIPVLFYFTGIHQDYHKPTDDADKINYLGEAIIVKHIYSVIEAEDKQKEKLVFTKTKETQTATTSRFSVTMGIMPDYTFNGVGVRIDGISDNRPAQKAGLKAGDVILSLGNYQTGTLENYMQALGEFKKGDKTKVVFTRAGQTLSSIVEF